MNLNIAFPYNYYTYSQISSYDYAHCIFHLPMTSATFSSFCVDLLIRTTFIPHLANWKSSGKKEILANWIIQLLK